MWWCSYWLIRILRPSKLIEVSWKYGKMDQATQGKMQFKIETRSNADSQLDIWQCLNPQKPDHLYTQVVLYSFRLTHQCYQNY